MSATLRKRGLFLRGLKSGANTQNSSASDSQDESLKSNKTSEASVQMNDLDENKFNDEGIMFQGKLIGHEYVAEARGEQMCQQSLKKLKIIQKAVGGHKQKINLFIAFNGIKIVDSFTNETLFHHTVPQISFISRDETDTRAFGYVFGNSQTGHQFIGIKTKKEAMVVMSTIGQLFAITLKRKKTSEEAATVNQKSSASALSEEHLYHSVQDGEISDHIQSNKAKSRPKIDLTVADIPIPAIPPPSETHPRHRHSAQPSHYATIDRTTVNNSTKKIDSAEKCSSLISQLDPLQSEADPSVTKRFSNSNTHSWANFDDDHSISIFSQFQDDSDTLTNMNNTINESATLAETNNLPLNLEKIDKSFKNLNASTTTISSANFDGIDPFSDTFEFEDPFFSKKHETFDEKHQTQPLRPPSRTETMRIFASNKLSTTNSDINCGSMPISIETLGSRTREQQPVDDRHSSFKSSIDLSQTATDKYAILHDINAIPTSIFEAIGNKSVISGENVSAVRRNQSNDFVENDSKKISSCNESKQQTDVNQCLEKHSMLLENQTGRYKSNQQANLKCDGESSTNHLIPECSQTFSKSVVNFDNLDILKNNSNSSEQSLHSAMTNNQSLIKKNLEPTTSSIDFDDLAKESNSHEVFHSSIQPILPVEQSLAPIETSTCDTTTSLPSNPHYIMICNLRSNPIDSKDEFENSDVELIGDEESVRNSDRNFKIDEFKSRNEGDKHLSTNLQCEISKPKQASIISSNSASSNNLSSANQSSNSEFSEIKTHHQDDGTHISSQKHDSDSESFSITQQSKSIDEEIQGAKMISRINRSSSRSSNTSTPPAIPPRTDLKQSTNNSTSFPEDIQKSPILNPRLHSNNSSRQSNSPYLQSYYPFPNNLPSFPSLNSSIYADPMSLHRLNYYRYPNYEWLGHMENQIPGSLSARSLDYPSHIMHPHIPTSSSSLDYYQRMNKVRNLQSGWNEYCVDHQPIHDHPSSPPPNQTMELSSDSIQNCSNDTPHRNGKNLPTKSSSRCSTPPSISDTTISGSVNSNNRVSTPPLPSPQRRTSLSSPAANSDTRNFQYPLSAVPNPIPTYPPPIPPLDLFYYPYEDPQAKQRIASFAAFNMNMEQMLMRYHSHPPNPPPFGPNCDYLNPNPCGQFFPYFSGQFPYGYRNYSNSKELNRGPFNGNYLPPYNCHNCNVSKKKIDRGSGPWANETNVRNLDQNSSTVDDKIFDNDFADFTAFNHDLKEFSDPQNNPKQNHLNDDRSPKLMGNIDTGRKQLEVNQKNLSQNENHNIFTFSEDPFEDDFFKT
ncbi:Protein disabled [Sarcoptes scabiei]|nr:Protein disabled [Sarcoptes scabiei]